MLVEGKQRGGGGERRERQYLLRKGLTILALMEERAASGRRCQTLSSLQILLGAPEATPAQEARDWARAARARLLCPRLLLLQPSPAASSLTAVLLGPESWKKKVCPECCCVLNLHLELFQVSPLSPLSPDQTHQNHRAHPRHPPTRNCSWTLRTRSGPACNARTCRRGGSRAPGL